MFARIGTVRIALVLASALVFLTAGIMTAQTPPNSEDAVTNTTNRLLDAINGEDVTAAMNLLEATTLFDGFGFCPSERCVGQTIKAALDTAANENVRLTRVSGTHRVFGDIAIAEVELRADAIRNGGAERLLYQLESEVKEGKISRVRFSPILSDATTARFLGTGTPASVGPRPIRAPATGDGGLLNDITKAD